MPVYGYFTLDSIKNQFYKLFHAQYPALLFMTLYF